MKNKDYYRLVGTGVAIMCSGQCVRKYLIAAVRTEFGCGGVKLLGVSLMAPRYEQEYWKQCGWATEDENHVIWVKPEACYRNKGDCARHHAYARLDTLDRRIRLTESEMEQTEKKEKELKADIELLKEREKALLNEFEKCRKWFRKNN